MDFHRWPESPSPIHTSDSDETCEAKVRLDFVTWKVVIRWRCFSLHQQARRAKWQVREILVKSRPCGEVATHHAFPLQVSDEIANCLTRPSERMKDFVERVYYRDIDSETEEPPLIWVGDPYWIHSRRP